MKTDAVGRDLSAGPRDQPLVVPLDPRGAPPVVGAFDGAMLETGAPGAHELEPDAAAAHECDPVNSGVTRPAAGAPGGDGPEPDTDVERLLLGGKGANLRALLRAGLPVPAGFCVTTAAFGRFLAAAGDDLPALLDRTAASPHTPTIGDDPPALLDRTAASSHTPTTGDDPPSLPDRTAEAPDSRSSAGDALRTRLRNTKVPLEVEAAVREALERSSTTPSGSTEPAAWAVRSSATAEDLLHASFAGQQDTFLNVRGIDAVLDRLRDCWVSLFSDRAIAYRARQGIDPRQVRMAVVIQRLVPAEVAGVAFTVDPISGRVDRLIIEASFGLGEAVVSGRVSPDRYVLDRTGLDIVEQLVGDKRLELIGADSGGLVELEVGGARARAVALEAEALRRIGRLALEAEALFGRPQDIEWAVAGGEVALLQSRAVTTLQPVGPDETRAGLEDVDPVSIDVDNRAAGYVPLSGLEDADRAHLDADDPTAGHAQRSRPADDSHVWTNMNTGEVVPDVLSPLTWSVFERTLVVWARDMLRSLGFDPGSHPVLGVIAGRVYFNISTILGMMRGFPIVRRLDPGRIFGGAQVDLASSGALEALERSVPRVRVHPLRFFWRTLTFGIWLLTRSRRSAVRRYEAVQAESAAWGTGPLEPLSEQALVTMLEEGVTLGFRGSRDLGGYAMLGMAHFFNLERIGTRWLGVEGLSNRMLTGLGAMASANAGLDMWRVADAARAHPDLLEAVRSAQSFAALEARIGALEGGAVFLERWRSFMAEHGHHARGEIELMNPRWDEMPDYVLGMVRGYLVDGAPDALARHRAQAEAREAETAAHRRRLWDPIRRRIFDHVLEYAQWGIQYRENVKSDAVRVLTRARRVVLELGRRLAGRGVLARAEDVFFLRMDELERAVKARGAAGEGAGARFDARTDVGAGFDARTEVGAGFDARTDVGAGFDARTEVGAGFDARTEVGAGFDARTDVGAGFDARTEVGAGFDARTVVATRRAAYERNLRLTPPPVVVGRFKPAPATEASDALPAQTGRMGPGRVLKGLAVSPGRVSGPARVILRADAAERVLPGEILVAPFTDPGWTPYFLTAAAVVIDMGGLLSHGSICAREYGIPAVVNVGPATRTIRNGQRLEVDGGRGEVRILTDPPQGPIEASSARTDPPD